MSRSTKKKAGTLAQAKALKRANAVTALLCGGIPAVIFALSNPPDPKRYMIGFFIGLLWSNCFEYLYHRFLLHLPGSFFARHHLLHHASAGTPSEYEHVTFGRSPLWIFILFLANDALVVLAELIFRPGLAPGILTAFAVYFMAVEEIHWRIHLGGWLPTGMRASRAYHLAHHDRADGRFNVFLPLFDWVFSTAGSPTSLRNPQFPRPH
jgi:fatty acid hydroxylase family protein